MTGCTKVSAGCDHCYAHTLAHVRLAAVYLRQLPVVRSAANDADPFAVRLWPERLGDPARWRVIADANHLDNPRALETGMSLSIPKIR